MKIFLSPHNDDESLFGAFTLIRESPLVVVCLRSETQASRGDRITSEQREKETACAMAVLGCDWVQWPVSDLKPDWDDVEHRMRALRDENDVDEVFAPEAEIGGHAQHNVIAEIAAEVFGSVTSYLTYTREGKSKWGQAVAYEPAWAGLKFTALSCYQSQMTHPLQAEHFIRSWREYYAT